ncbi:Putative uncharacterized protein [Taphrina deformans PYCC 5710]|uniref:DUF4211 domain-containing protein n=1 Tax=Taphrina deformans (strain PYCC 5710 / ATCC 11124 / CBS 356.35 / IMI 108563 / JCM 9778 / NBRC 8474) TaxID=1097556 RepID=R4X723_TAPDE|nr:Putative uncharacterized protein [Taphrina deformans PYCC 5710]|eukprot:CCG81036.1 Putative uncharacterized protein [Taphrina deformans PYCC 5710]
MPSNVEKEFVKLGKPYARGGPASKRKKKATSKKPFRAPALKQTQISLSPAAKKDKTRKSTDHFLPVSDDESDPQGASNQSYKNVSATETAETQSPRALNKKSAEHKSRMHQSRINFEPGGERFISTDPIDSEEEEFRVRVTSTGHSSSGGDSDAAQQQIDEKRRSRIPMPIQTPKRIVIDSDSEEDLVTPLRRRKRFMPTDSAPIIPADSEELIGTCSPVHARRSSQIVEAQVEARDLDHKLIKTTKIREGNKKRNAFRDNLERLRRKKAGLPSASESDYGDEEQESVEPDVKDWIVEDDVDRRQFLDELPTEFQQPRQPMEQFKIAIQWEILDLLLPQGGLAPDAYFKPAIEWLRDRTSGKSQAAISSIWRRPFVKALQRGPDLNAIETGNLGFFCDACGRTNRVATYVVKFEGSRYDRMTLEDLDTDASSSEDDLDVDENAASDVEVERARKERILRAEWNLGINCYERTCVAHELFHVRKHLREEIYAKLKYLGLFTAAKKVERSILTKSRRIELANQVTEELDQVRFQQRLWSRYKATIEKNEEYIVDPNAGRKKSRYG